MSRAPHLRVVETIHDVASGAALAAATVRAYRTRRSAEERVAFLSARAARTLEAYGGQTTARYHIERIPMDER